MAKIIGLSSWGRRALATAGALSVGTIVLFGYLVVDATRSHQAEAGPIGAAADSAVQATLQARLPKTSISSVDCAKLSGVCEVTAGRNLFYVDRSARYLVIGRVYDMETRQDLTAARLLELAPDALVAGSARAEGSAEGEGSPPRRAITTLPLRDLPTTGAIRWGPASGPKLVVFSDLQCGYCRQLVAELKTLGARVEERPISVLGSRALSNAVYCAADPARALHRAYEGVAPQGSPVCDTSGLDANEAFARRHGLAGTPVVVRASDGAVIEGYRPAAVLAGWVRGGPA